MSIINETIIPTMINTNVKINVLFLFSLNNNSIDSGIRSITDTHIITPAAKLREYFSTTPLLSLKNINNDPIIVEMPAINVNINAIVMLDMLSPY